jgi:hypothetical protein
VLDSAHVGDIEGALGRIRLSDNDRPRTLRTRPATLLAIVEPGLIVIGAILLVVKAIQLGST